MAGPTLIAVPALATVLGVSGLFILLYFVYPAPLVALVADSDNVVRRKAAGAIGHLRDAAGRVALEQQLTTDPDPVVRRNAAWALGRIGDVSSRSVLEAATRDESGLVRMVARQALRQLN